MAAKRSRTGCQTCRARKLKCDEIRPRCGQCTKSRRECVPSDGIAFRHEQNASMNAAGSGEGKGLQNFFKYRNEFDPEQMRNFVPIPKELKFVHITDPFSEEQNPASGNPPTSPGSYQQVAAHSLEALSTAATDHPTYGHNFTDYTAFNAGTIPVPGAGAAQGTSTTGRSGYGPASNLSGLHAGNQTNGINFLLNPSNIDPSLEIDTQLTQQQNSHHQNHADIAQISEAEKRDEQVEEGESGDMHLAALLRDAGAAHEAHEVNAV